MDSGVDTDAAVDGTGDGDADANVDDESDADIVDTDADVVVVGGGPAGCSVGVFTARYGLDTVVFDRGNSSIRRCAYLENYLGFPGGIDIDTFYGVMHDHIEEAGCDLVASLVGSVSRSGDGPFRVESDDGRSVTTRFVVAATKYDADYLRGLDGERLFRTVETDGTDEEARGDGEESREEFDSECVDADGRTPVAGLYVAGPLGGGGDQAIIAAGHGATVARSLIADSRRDRGYWDDVATHYDWIRREAELADEWRDRERWVEYFDERRTPENVDLDDDERERIRDTCIDDRLSAYVTSDDIDRRASHGQRYLAEHLDVEAVVATSDAEHILEAIDDEVIRAYLDDAPAVHRV